MDPRIFWKIIVDVDHYNQIHIKKEVALWHLRQDAWYRLRWQEQDLTSSLKSKPDNEDPNSNVWDGAIYFNGDYYLEAKDPGLLNLLVMWYDDFQRFKDFPETMASEPVFVEGEYNTEDGMEDIKNIFNFLQIVTGKNNDDNIYPCNFVLEQDGNQDFSRQFCREVNPHGEEEHRYLGENVRIDTIISTSYGGPIFHYPQYPHLETDPSILPYDKNLDRVILSEDSSRKIDWEISRKPGPYFSKRFQLQEAPRQKHQLTVNQDYNCDTNNYYFRMLVDAVPLKPDPEYNYTPAAHSFPMGEAIFHIGLNPVTEEYFDGLIWRIVFDPNSSCGSC